MNHWGANHGAFVHGHIGSDLITLASMLRIPVTLHNVPRERIFRPNIFEGAGTKSLETADFEICRLLGPLYKNRFMAMKGVTKHVNGKRKKEINRIWEKISC